MLWWSLGSENFNRIWSILSYVVILVKYSLGRVFGGFGCHFRFLAILLFGRQPLTLSHHAWEAPHIA